MLSLSPFQVMELISRSAGLGAGHLNSVKYPVRGLTQLTQRSMYDTRISKIPLSDLSVGFGIRIRRSFLIPSVSLSGGVRRVLLMVDPGTSGGRRVPVLEF